MAGVIHAILNVLMEKYIKRGFIDYQMERISVIIPTYNESENIETLVRGVFDVYPNSSVIVVDDDSPDRTWQIAQGLSKKFNVKVIRRVNDRGLGSAVIEGFKHAKTRIIGVMDADLSHPPEKIPELVAALSDADIAVGSRLVKGGGVEDWPWYRKMISKMATLMARPLTEVKDPMSGFFFFDKKIIKDCKLETKGYKILLEILVKGDYDKVAEVPYVFRNREVGKSKISISEYLGYVKSIVSLMMEK